MSTSFTSSEGASVTVPVGSIRQRLDNDAADYVFSPELYLTLALAYDSLAAPTVRTGSDGVDSPDFTAMRPRLATSWAEQENGDWIVGLRPGVLSAAGHELTSADVAWSFDKAADQGVMASWRWFGVVGVTAVEAVDRYTVRYRLRAPYPTFPNWLLSVSPNLVDSTEVLGHATADDPFGLAWLAGHAAGYGAYALESMDATRLEFRARGERWDGAASLPDRVDVALVDSRAEGIALLDDGAAVVVSGLDCDEAAAQLRRGDDRRIVRTWGAHSSVEIDFTLAPFDDVRVRQALAYATPYEQVIGEGFLGLARAWRSPVKGVSQWYDARPLPYNLDLGRARDLLRAAGYGTGISSTLHTDPHPAAMRTAEILQRSWAEVGVTVDIEVIGPERPGWLPPLWVRNECAHNLSEPVYDIAHDYAAMNPLLPLPGGPAHVGNWRPRWTKNPEIIERLVAVLLDPARERKEEAVLELQRAIVAASTSIFLAETQQTMVASPAVPRALTQPDSRFYQALQLQNATSGYLPARRP